VFFPDSSSEQFGLENGLNRSRLCSPV